MVGGGLGDRENDWERLGFGTMDWVGADCSFVSLSPSSSLSLSLSLSLDDEDEEEEEEDEVVTSLGGGWVFFGKSTF